MKRALLVLIAAVLVLLVYPSTHPLSASPGKLTYDMPNIISSKTITPPIDLNGNDDDDDGDADDITGTRSSKTNPSASSYQPGSHARITLTLQMWWNFLFGIR